MGSNESCCRLHNPRFIKGHIMLNELVRSAERGEMGLDCKEIAKIGLETTEMLIRKNQDYGSSAFDAPILGGADSATSAILVRMSDKISRIRTLLKNQNAHPNANPMVIDESVTDTMLDLAGYCLLYVVASNRSQKQAATICVRPRGDQPKFEDEVLGVESVLQMQPGYEQEEF